MIIKRLTMKDFGVYAGVNTFHFTHKNPIVLIGGMNGRGKTTFLEAILLSLYGSNSNGYKESKFKSYGRYLRSFVNKYSISQQTYVELEFSMNEGSSETYLIHREWDALTRTTQESIWVQENGERNEFLTKNWAMFVENILPSALSAFYFFDGEKIAELAVDDTNAQMKESIRTMLGLSVLDMLQNDLNRSLRRTTKQIKNTQTSTSIDHVREQKEKLQKKLECIDHTLAGLAEQIQGKREKIDTLHHKYEAKGGAAIEQRKDLMQKRSNLLVAMDQNHSKLIEAVSGELPLVMVKDLIQNIKLQAVEEHNDFIMKQTLEQIDDLLAQYLKVHPEQSEANHAFVRYIKDSTIEDDMKSVYDMSDQALFQLNTLLESLLESSRKTASDLMKKKQDLEKRLNAVESYLSLDVNEKDLQKTYAAIKKNEEALVNLEIQQAKCEQERLEICSDLNAKTSELNHLIEEYLKNAEMQDDSERMVKYTNIAVQIAKRYTVELQKRKTGVLGETITDCYTKLANKKNLIKRIVMDPSTLDVAYYDDNNELVPKESLSAGEKQMMVIAILWALAICSKKKLPVIIDTPLSRLDSRHRTSLITTYFPNASEQTIILSTDSEINREYYNLMKDYIGDEFTLLYDEQSRSTTIKKGYFGEA